MKVWLTGIFIVVLLTAQSVAQIKLGLCTGDDAVIAEFREPQGGGRAAQPASSTDQRGMSDPLSAIRKPAQASHRGQPPSDVPREEHQR